jgi:probable F420-dependent oxidoreductase
LFWFLIAEVGEGVKVGVTVLNFGRGTTPESLLARARITEAMGFHSAFISDHVAITPDVRARYPEPFYDTFATLAWLAGQTERITLGTTVCVLPYRHPVEMARLTANIDQFSRGRFVFGVGVGGNKLEFSVLGVPVERRGAISNEYLEVIHALWTQDELTYHGRFVTLDDVSGVQTYRTEGRPNPPVWVGGRSDAAMRRTVRFDAAWHPNRMTPRWLRDTGLPRLREIADDMGGKMPALCPRIQLEITDKPIEGDDRIFGVGTLEQIHEDFVLLDQLGAEHVILDWYVHGDPQTVPSDEDGWRQLSLLADQVLDLNNEQVR